MKSRKEGYVVITASQAALMGIFGLSIYSATKFALRGLAESLYMEVRIRQNTCIIHQRNVMTVIMMNLL